MFVYIVVKMMDSAWVLEYNHLVLTVQCVHSKYEIYFIFLMELIHE